MFAAFALLLIAGHDFTEVSGVKVSCLENLRGKAGRARVEVIVASGALHEAENARGVAHLLEHLLMRPLGFDDKNAATAWDYTSYFHDVRAAELSTAAIDLVRALAKVDLPEGSFELEREVVLQEMKLRGSRESSVKDPIFGGTILARDPGGTEESVRALTRDDVFAFHAANYVRGNIAVIARGAVDCAAFAASLAPALARLPEGRAVTLPRVLEKERGARALPIGWEGNAFVEGFYWYDANVAEEMVMRVVAKHLEQSALDDLRKGQGLTYSPQAEVRRVGSGGVLQLRVVTEGKSNVVSAWYEEKIRELRDTPAPATVMKRALPVVADLVDSDAVRLGLAAIRGEEMPDRALAALDDNSIRAMLPKMLHRDRTFGSTTPSRNIGSIIVLVVFALVVLGAAAIAGRRFGRAA
jgi:hypothetical protein